MRKLIHPLAIFKQLQRWLFLKYSCAAFFEHTCIRTPTSAILPQLINTVAILVTTVQHYASLLISIKNIFTYCFKISLEIVPKDFLVGLNPRKGLIVLCVHYIWYTEECRLETLKLPVQNIMKHERRCSKPSYLLARSSNTLRNVQHQI